MRWQFFSLRARKDRGWRRLVGIYGAVLLALALSLSGRPPTEQAVSGLVMPVLPSGPQVPPAILASALGAGLPTMGLAARTRHRAPAVSAQQVGGWLLSGLADLRVGDPVSFLTQGFPVLLSRPLRKAPVKATWKGLPLTKSAGGATTRGSVTSWGTNPLVAIYATNTEDSLLGWLPKGTKLAMSDNAKTNMVELGHILGQDLWQEGVPVVQSTSVSDKSGQIGAYIHSQAVAANLIQDYPEARFLLDLDRSATGKATLTVKDQTFAPIEVVVGSSAMLPLPHPQKNIALGQSLVKTLNEIKPGIASFVRSRDRLNQQVSTVSLTVRVGSAASPLDVEQRSLAVLATALAQDAVVAP